MFPRAESDSVIASATRGRVLGSDGHRSGRLPLAACRKVRATAEQVPYVALGKYDSPTGLWSHLKDVRDGYPQFYGVRRA